MPREARRYYNGFLYHVMVQGINKENIFHDAIQKNIYIKLMFKHAFNRGVKVIAYCIMDNHAHLLLSIKDVNAMSNYMKIINQKFAMIYNEMEKRVGVVFRNRFESELIYDEKYFYNCVRYIHNNPVKAGIVRQAKEYKFSSANNYSLEKILYELKLKNNTIEDDIGNFIDIDKDKIVTEKMEIIIKQFCKENNIFEISSEDKRLVKKLVRILKEKTKAKNTKIARRLRVIIFNSYKLFKKINNLLNFLFTIFQRTKNIFCFL